MADILNRVALDRFINRHDVCGDAREWLDANKDLTPRQLWESCQEFDWLIWILDCADMDDEITDRLQESDVVRVWGLRRMIPFETVEAMIILHERLTDFGLYRDVDDQHSPDYYNKNT